MNRYYNVVNILLIILLSLWNKADAQVSISGPTCVVPGTQYQYTISGSWNSGTYMSWCVNGGYIVNNGGGSCKSGTPQPSIQVVFTSTTSGSVDLSSDIGSSNKYVTMTTSLSGGTISTNQSQTISSGSIPASINCSVATGGACSPSYSYQWQSSPDNIVWTNVSMATGQNIIFSSGVTQTTYYKRKVTENSSGSIAYSNSATVFISAPLQAGSISGGTSPITNNTSPGQLTSTSASGGSCNGAYSYQWQVSSDNTSFSDISGATALNYTPPALTVTMYYRISVSCSGTTVYSSAKEIIVKPPLQPGTIISGNQIIPYNSLPSNLITSAPSGGNCGDIFTYQWEISSDNINYTIISGATALDLTFSASLTQTRYYRRRVVCGTETKYTYPIKIEVGTVLTGGSGSSNQVIGYNTTPSILSVTNSTGGICNGFYFYQWQISDNGTVYTDIQTEVYSTLNYSTPITINKYFRRKVICGNEIAYSSATFVQVNFNAGILGTPQGIISGASANTLSVSGTSGGACSGAYIYSWEKSLDGLSWSVVGTNASSYSPGVLTQTSSFRVKVLCNNLVSYTNSVVIKIINNPAVNLPNGSVAISTISPVSMPDYVASMDPLNQNYVRSRSFKKNGLLTLSDANLETDLFNVTQSTEYSDGLGRPIQIVNKGFSGSGKDIISANWYDNSGKTPFQYLEYSDNLNSGNLRTDAAAKQLNFYNTYLENSDGFYYSSNIYENSPLGTVLKSSSPGKSWAGSERGVRVSMRTNLGSEDVKIWKIEYSSGSQPTVLGVYQPGELVVTITTSEDNNQTIEYKDKLGHTILKKVQAADNYSVSHDGWLCTYYVYDDLNRLRFVMPPKAVEFLSGASWALNSEANEQLCFRYEYDLRNRLIVKKVPGAQEVHMVYDKRDRMILSQDGNMTGVKWNVSKYDDLGRIKMTGIYSSTGTRSAMQSSIDEDINFPTLAASDINTELFYDDYSWMSGVSGISGSLNSSDITSSNFYTSPSGFPVYSEDINSTQVVRGMSTGTKTRKLGSSVFYYAANIIDKKGRLVQIQSHNAAGGTDVRTTQYDFTNKVIRNHIRHVKAGTNSQTHTILTIMEYDHMGRLVSVKNNLNDLGEKVIAQIAYDELGRMLSKEIGKLPTNEFLEKLDFRYNVRGWLKSINRDFSRDDNSAGANNRWFGMELFYDWGYTENQYNSNISGLQWRSKGDKERRSYGFDYDNINRLTKADFNQYTSNAWNLNAGIDFSVSNLTYEANGNIKSLNQKGWKITGSDFIDKLTYKYKGTEFSNLLSAVTDNFTSTDQGKFADFKDGSNGTSDDYVYDNNGNLISDLNKQISNITYNHFNLPTLITITGKGTIAYEYDGNGNKLSKTVTDNTVTPVKVTTTLYSSGVVYENDILQFIVHEEGRIRYTPAEGSVPAKMDYDYFIKDHLGNVRVVLTDENSIKYYPAASLEGTYTAPGGTPVANSMINQETKFYNIDYSKVVLESSIPSWGTESSANTKLYYNNNGNPPQNTSYPSGALPTQTDGSNKLYKLNAGTNKTGLEFMIKVMAGDKVDIFGKSYYLNTTAISNSNSTALDITTLLAGLLAAPGSVAGGKGITSTQLSSLNSGLIPQSFIRGANNETGTTVPKAFINYIFFDDQFKFVSGNFSRVGTSGLVKSHWNTDAQLQNIEAPKNGYLFVYVSNESNFDVFFDNLQVVHKPGPLVEETHYYPFGLTMAGISSRAMGRLENRYKFNDGTELENKEFSDGAGLELYATDFRGYDPQIGRFHQIDLLADLSHWISPFAFANNNPISFNDPFGLTAEPASCPDCPTGRLAEIKTLAEVVVTAKKNKSSASNSPDPSQALAGVGSAGSAKIAASGVVPMPYYPPINVTLPAINPAVVAPIIVVGGTMLIERIGGGNGPMTIPIPVNGGGDISSYVPRPFIPAVAKPGSGAVAIPANPAIPTPNNGWGEQYTLRARKSGFYPNYEWGKGMVNGVWLNKGDIWKIGKSINGRRRYPNNYYDSVGQGLDYVEEYSGPPDTVLFVEMMKLVNYRMQHNGKYPPGNTKLQ